METCQIYCGFILTRTSFRSFHFGGYLRSLQTHAENQNKSFFWEEMNGVVILLLQQ